MKPVLCIAGPTASGKSAWAIKFAKRYDGEIINADALQVYRQLQILSARPTESDMSGVPHHLFGHIDGKHIYSTGQWVREVLPIIFDCLSRDKLPILIGGTGLYFNALLRGLAEIPDVPADIQKQTQAILDEEGIARLRSVAEALDPVAAAKVLGNDPHRLLRIVGVARGTDKPLSVWRQETRPILPRQYSQRFVLLPDRAALYDRINQRFETMVDSGGWDEIVKLRAEKLSANLPIMKAIGVKPLLDHMNGDISRDRALELAKRDTRRFAKRQFTWFRGQAKDWTCAQTEAEKHMFLENFADIVD